MNFLYHRFSFIFELIVSGSYLLLYILYRFGQELPVWNYLNADVVQESLSWLVYSVPLSIAFTVFGHFFTYRNLERLLRKSVFSVILLIPSFIVWGDQEFSFWLGVIHIISSMISINDPLTSESDESQLNISFYSTLNLNPAQLIMTTFFLLVLSGTALLSLPICHQTGITPSFFDHLFIATSAICVTGLTTLNIAETYTPLGQVVLILLAQIGGLGIMTLSSCFALLMGKSLAMKEKVLMQGLLDINSMEDILDMVVEIVRLTFIIEVIGMVALSIIFFFNGMDLGTALFSGFFHAISAFCQAGFSTFPTGLEGWKHDIPLNIVVMSLITLGGLGFLVIKDIRLNIFHRKKGFAFLSLHSKIVISMNFTLIFLGAFIIFFGEFLNASTLDNLSFIDKIMVSFFQSISSRSAGLNTINLAQMNMYVLFFIMLLMFIGAAPGSTGGGIKVTTIAILLQTIRSTLKGSSRVEIFGRTLSSPLIIKACALTIIFFATLSFFIFLLLIFEGHQNFFVLMFEVLSAFCTVGYSLGITSELSDPGKVILSLAMFVGRVGPLTLVLAVGEISKSSGRIHYPDGKIMIG